MINMDEKASPHQRQTPVSTSDIKAKGEAAEIVERSPKKQPDAILASYGGPLPLPAHFEHFDRVLPGAAERILSMAEAEQRSRLTMEQHESLVATDLAKREATLQEASINGRLSIERLGIWLGFATNVIVMCGALTFAYIAPDRLEKIASLFVAVALGAAQVVVAFKRGSPPTPPKSGQQPPSTSATGAKRHRSR
jgi:uncharacterized membrane protein